MGTRTYRFNWRCTKRVFPVRVRSSSAGHSDDLRDNFPFNCLCVESVSQVHERTYPEETIVNCVVWLEEGKAECVSKTSSFAHCLIPQTTGLEASQGQS